MKYELLLADGRSLVFTLKTNIRTRSRALRKDYNPKMCLKGSLIALLANTVDLNPNVHLADSDLFGVTLFQGFSESLRW